MDEPIGSFSPVQGEVGLIANVKLHFFSTPRTILEISVNLMRKNYEGVCALPDGEGNKFSGGGG